MKGKSTKKSRLKLAEYLGRHLGSFGGDINGVVICPTCLGMLEIDHDQDQITAGHILPEASGGNEWTLLCRGCNSRFGERQDKWFGEYLLIQNNPKGTFLHAKTKSKYITINGEAFRGHVYVSDAEDIVNVFLPTDRNPPGKVQRLDIGSTVQFTFQPELLRHENEIEIGYITAAYLMWFDEAGYNWVFQSSLDVVRQQILECNRDLDGATVIDLDTDKAEMQGVGVVFNGDSLYPCCVVVDKLVIFPAPSTARAPKPKGVKFESPCDIQFLRLGVFTEPYITLYEGHQVIVPDSLKRCPPVPNLALNIHAARDPEWLVMQSDT